MGRVLQVRLYAYTYAEEDARSAWPTLWKIAFEETKPGFPHDKKGVLELVRALDDLYQFGDIPGSFRKILEQDLSGVLGGVNELQRQLAEWNPQAANRATDLIEDRLNELEKQAPRAWAGE